MSGGAGGRGCCIDVEGEEAVKRPRVDVVRKEGRKNHKHKRKHKHRHRKETKKDVGAAERDNGDLHMQEEASSAHCTAPRKRKRRCKSGELDGSHCDGEPITETTRLTVGGSVCEEVTAEEREDGRLGHVLALDAENSLLEEGGADEEGVDRFMALHEKFERSTKFELERLRQRVGEWKLGRWSVDEVEQLKKNIRDFMKDHQVTDIAHFIFENGSKKHGKLGKGTRNINRPLLNIYRKTTRVCDINNYVGRWTEEQEKQLVHLHSIHGSRWALIGRNLEMSAEAVKSKYRLIKKQRKGEWLAEEEQKLVKAIQELWRQVDGGYEGVTGEDLPPTATWQDVASRVGTRNAYQCREKWVMRLHWAHVGMTERWSQHDSIQLLKELANQDADDEESVGWSELCEGWDNARGRAYLRSKWTALKREVPNYRIKSFHENLDYLLEHRLPALEKAVQQKDRQSD